jgi:hypothetical protein
MFRSNVQVGRGVIRSNRQPLVTAAPQTNAKPDYRMATPAQAAALRQRYIDAGIIGKRAAS